MAADSRHGNRWMSNQLSVLLASMICALTTTFVNGNSCESQKMLKMNGDIMLGGFFPLRLKPGPGSGTEVCSTPIDAASFQNLEAFVFALKKLNADNFIPGVKFGGIAWDTCGDINRAQNSLMDYISVAEAQRKASCNASSVVMYPGIIGEKYSANSMKISEIITPLNSMVQISGLSQATKLSDKTEHPYFSRTVANAGASVKIWMKILTSILGWSHVSMIAGNDPVTESIQSEFTRQASQESVCITNLLKIKNDATIEPAAIEAFFAKVMETGAHGVVVALYTSTMDYFFSVYKSLNLDRSTMFIFLLPEVNNVDLPGVVSMYSTIKEMKEFKTYYLSLTPAKYTNNPWFSEYWKHLYNSSQAAVDQSKREESYEEYPYTSSVVSAVFAFANALKEAHGNHCSGKPGLCKNMSEMSAKEMTRYIRKQSFESLAGTKIYFDENGDMANPEADIFNTQLDGPKVTSREIGHFSYGHLNMTGNIKFYNGSNPIPNALSMCSKCPCLNPPSKAERMLVGDSGVVIAGLFGVNRPGGSDKECDLNSFTDADFQSVEAMLFTVDAVNNNPDILPNTKLSATILNTCHNNSRSVRLVNQILHKDRCTDGDGDPVLPSVYIGPTWGVSTEDLLHCTGWTKTSVIGMSDASPSLSDKEKYPHFVRTISDDTNEIRALMDLVKHLGLKNLTVMYSEGQSGESGAKEILKMSKDSGVCVQAVIDLKPYYRTRGTFQTYAEMFKSKYVPKNVVFLGRSEDARGMLRAVKNAYGNNTSDIVWIGTSHWGTDKYVTVDLDDIAAGALVLTSRKSLPKENASFLNHFKSIRPDVDNQNIWLKDYWQYKFKCDFPEKMTYGVPCDNNQTFNDQDIQPQAGATIDAVLAFAHALHNLISDHCPSNPSKCPPVKDLSLVNNYIKKVAFVSKTGRNVSFDMFGNSAPHYEIFNYKREDNSSYKYSKVGSWAKGILQLNSTSVVLVGGKAISDMKEKCDKCACLSEFNMDIKYKHLSKPFSFLGMVPIHKSDGDGRICGQFSAEGFINMKAMEFAAAKMRNSFNGSGLGYLIFDDCDDPNRAKKLLSTVSVTYQTFIEENAVPIWMYEMLLFGGYSDKVTRALQMYPNNFHLQMTPVASSTMSKNRTAQETLVRLSADQLYTLQAMIDFLKEVRWSHVSLVCSPDNEDKMASFKRMLEKAGYCSASEYVFKLGNETFASGLVKNLVKRKDTPVVVLFLSDDAAREFLASVKNHASDLYLLSSTAWQPGVESQYPKVVKNSITLSAHNPKLDGGFIHYVRQTTLKDIRSDPWMSQFWQEHFKCNLGSGRMYNKHCTGREQLTESDVRQYVTPYTQATIDGISLYVSNAERILQRLCGNYKFLSCPESFNPSVTKEMFQLIVNESLVTRNSGINTYMFDSNGHLRPHLNIMRYYEVNKKISAVQVGVWNGALKLSRQPQFYTKEGSRVQSWCESNCDHCLQSSQNGKGSKPRFGALFQERTTFGLVIIVLSSVGVAVVLLILVLFCCSQYKSTFPGLLLLLLFSVFLMFVLNFSLLSPPSFITCSVNKAAIEFLNALALSVLILRAKAVHLHDTSKEHVTTGKQLAFLLFLVLPEIAILIQCLYLDMPAPTTKILPIHGRYEPPKFSVISHCEVNEQTLVSLWYIFFLFLVLLVTIFRCCCSRAFYHEAKLLFVTWLFSAGAMIAWIYVVAMIGGTYVMPAFCVGNTTMASVFLMFVLVPRLCAMRREEHIRPKVGKTLE